MMVKAFARIIGSSVLKGSAAAFATKFGASVAGFTMFALASRYMEPVSFGSLAIIFNAMSFLSVAALCGQETLIVRSWGEYRGANRPALARGALAFGVQVASGAAVVTAALTAFVWLLWDRSVPVPLVLAACAYLVAYALMQFSGQFTRVACGVLLGEIPRELMWRVMVVVAIGAFHVLAIPFDATGFFVVSTGAILTALMFQIWRVAPTIPDAVRQAQPERDMKVWRPRAFKMWLSAMLDTTGQYLEVVVIGLILGPAAAGFYFVATRITNGFAMITGSISIYAMPQISHLFYTGAKDELQRVLRTLAVIGAVLSGGAFLSIVVAGKLLLWAFGTPYIAAYPGLIVLAAGAATGALVGPAAHVLLLTGHEGVYPRIVSVVLCIRFALFAVLGPALGLMGVAAAWSISAAVLTVALIVACRRRVGLDPSLGSWLGVARQPLTQLKAGTP
jgi:O-antigen/teichoic acid export membrane protein